MRAQAGLCLRCYVSETILKTCQDLVRQFGSHGQFSLQDLLSNVLNDDGKQLIILDEIGQSQLILEPPDTMRSTAFEVFSVKGLQTFNPDLEGGMSLESWVSLQTRRAPDLKAFLSEYGFRLLSDWALLNRVGATQLAWLAEMDRLRVKAFHEVYRGDRIQQSLRSKCLPPTPEQMVRMQQYLEKHSAAAADLQIADLQRLATQLRSYDVWNTQDSIDLNSLPVHLYEKRERPDYDLDPLAIEQQELAAFLKTQLELAVNQAIEQQIQGRIETLQKSRTYARFAHQWVPGMRLYYEQGLTLRDIVPQLGMTSWDQARRILNPGQFLRQVRSQVMSQLLKQTLEKAHQMGFTPLPPQSDYLKNLSEQIEAFADAEFFQEAAEELRVGKDRFMSGQYALRLRHSLLSVSPENYT